MTAHAIPYASTHKSQRSIAGRLFTPNALRGVVACVALVAACIALGAEATALAPSFPVWELGMVAFALFGAVMWRTLGAAHPLSWMSILYSLYFLLGSQSWVEASAHLGFRNYVAAEPTLRLAFIGLVAFSLGATVTAGVRRHPRTRLIALSETDDQHAGLARNAGLLLTAVGVLGLVMSVRGGLPILQPAIRSEANHGPWAYCAYALVPAGLLLILNPTSARRDAMVLGTLSLLLIVMAYRSPIILLVGTFLMLRQVQGRMRKRTVLLGTLGLLAFALIVFSYRASVGVRGGYIVPSGLLREFPVLFPLYSGFAREGFSVFARVHELIPSSHAFMHGALQLSMFHIHEGAVSPRQTIYNIVNGTNVARTTYTPTLLGGPYMDFGALGVVSEMFVIGLVCGGLYRAAIQRLTAWRALWYSYSTVLVAMAIHTGLLDDATLVIVPLMVAISVVAARTIWSRKRSPAGFGETARMTPAGHETPPSPGSGTR
jgi:Putative O-antigen polymerase